MKNVCFVYKSNHVVLLFKAVTALWIQPMWNITLQLTTVYITVVEPRWTEHVTRPIAFLNLIALLAIFVIPHFLHKMATTNHRWQIIESSALPRCWTY